MIKNIDAGFGIGDKFLILKNKIDNFLKDGFVDKEELIDMVDSLNRGLLRFDDGDGVESSYKQNRLEDKVDYFNIKIILKKEGLADDDKNKIKKYFESVLAEIDASMK